TTPTHGPGRSQHVLKRGTQFEITSRTANALAQEGVSQTGVTRYADTAIVQKGARSTAGRKQLVAVGIIDHRLNGTVVLGQSNGNGIGRVPMDKVGCAVQGINDPAHAYTVSGRLRGRWAFAGLFCQKAVIRISSLQHIDNGFFCRSVD